jgi:protein involved in polysaccharide export with SLBB domain
MERTITVSGAVRRPGTYELMPHENLRELIEAYGDGFHPLADKTRARLTRLVGGAEISGDIVLLTEDELTDNLALFHMDEIYIPTITSLRPPVTANRVERTITVSGAVRRPGIYELMPHETLRELIEVYGDGFTPLADPSRMELVRLINSINIAGDRLFLTESDIEDSFILEHFDSLYIPSTTQLHSVMFVEGAVNLPENPAALTTSRNLAVRFIEGETYASLVRRNTDWFSEVSDTQNAYIIRGNNRIPINLNNALYDPMYRGRNLIIKDDILVVPFRQFFVTVAGSVISPGRYPYIPDRDWEYYIGLAGGFIPNRNARRSIDIVDVNGNRLKKSDKITPETIITANTNHPIYQIELYGSVISSVLTVVNTIITIILITR